MVDTVVTMALETLRDLFIAEFKLLSAVEGEVEDVGRDLQRIHDILKDADKRPDIYESSIVRGWVSELIELATRAEDVLEKYDVEVTSEGGSKNVKEIRKRLIRIWGEFWARHEIGNETAAIKSRMAELNKDLESIRINGDQGSSCNDDQRLLRQTYGHETEERFVGMKNDIDLLVSHLQNDGRSYRAISICGMGGLGKTTLARKIYQHKLGFEARAWVCITQKLEAKAIYQDILRQLLQGENKERVKGMDEAELVRELYDIQKAKKCLVVLDDIWEIDHWNILKKAFPIAESNSKILLTTRDKRIAKEEFVYKLDFLTEDESWDLLQKIALPIEADSKQFEAIGRKLVRKCGRLPLAVSVIGGILREQPYLGDWNKVLANMDSYLKHEKCVNNNDKMVEQVLYLSYYELPCYLKLCFLYLGCFTEDENIRVEDVYLIWMAEGLISSDDKGRNETLRDVAERYLNELATRCLVHVTLVTNKLTLEIFKSCRLHDLVRDLCLSKGKEEKFFEDSQGKIRRLAINLSDDKEACSGAQFKNAKLRSLLLLSKWRSDCYDTTNIWQNLRCNALLGSLKVLVLENCKFEGGKLPDDVRKLVILKHLSIRDSEVEEVPEFVCYLPWLQSMDLRVRRNNKIPNSLDKLEQLKHLFLDHYGTKTIDGGKLSLDGSTKLETLIGFSSDIFDTNHLLKLINLRRFRGCVYDFESLSMVVEHFTKLKDRLREASLEIKVKDLSSEQGSRVIDSLMHCPVLDHLLIKGRLRRLPPHDPQLLQNLRSLNFESSEIEEDPMETLQHLPKLENLYLGWESFVGTEMVCGSKGFPQLKKLELSSLCNLEEWRVEQGAMPNLSDLKILSCRKLKKIPEGMASITNLTLSGCPLISKSG